MVLVVTQIDDKFNYGEKLMSKEKINIQTEYDLEFYEPIKVSIEDIEGVNKDKFSLHQEFRNMKKDLKENKGKGLKLIWIGLALLLISIGFFVGNIIMKTGGVKVNAIVCDVVETTTRDGQYVENYEVKLVYAYKDKRYDDVSYKDADEKIKIGDEVIIRINPKEPTKIYSNKGYMEIGLAAMGLGIIIIVGHFYMAWRKIYLAEECRTIKQLNECIASVYFKHLAASCFAARKLDFAKLIILNIFNIANHHKRACNFSYSSIFFWHCTFPPIPRFR